MFFKTLFILQVDGSPLTKKYESTEEHIVHYMVLLSGLVLFVQHGLIDFYGTSKALNVLQIKFDCREGDEVRQFLDCLQVTTL